MYSVLPDQTVGHKIIFDVGKAEFEALAFLHRRCDVSTEKNRATRHRHTKEVAYQPTHPFTHPPIQPTTNPTTHPPTACYSSTAVHTAADKCVGANPGAGVSTV